MSVLHLSQAYRLKHSNNRNMGFRTVYIIVNSDEVRQAFENDLFRLLGKHPQIRVSGYGHGGALFSWDFSVREIHDVLEETKVGNK